MLAIFALNHICAAQKPFKNTLVARSIALSVCFNVKIITSPSYCPTPKKYGFFLCCHLVYFFIYCHIYAPFEKDERVAPPFCLDAIFLTNIVQASVSFGHQQHTIFKMLYCARIVCVYGDVHFLVVVELNNHFVCLLLFGPCPYCPLIVTHLSAFVNNFLIKFYNYFIKRKPHLSAGCSL